MCTFSKDDQGLKTKQTPLALPAMACSFKARQRHIRLSSVDSLAHAPLQLLKTLKITQTRSLFAAHSPNSRRGWTAQS